jgi:hypothetical protein
MVARTSGGDLVSNLSKHELMRFSTLSRTYPNIGIDSPQIDFAEASTKEPEARMNKKKRRRMFSGM